MAIVRRMIRWYKGTEDALVGEAELTEISLGELQRIFGVPFDNPMYDCWPIQSRHLQSLQPYLKFRVELENYEYFIEAERPD